MVAVQNGLLGSARLSLAVLAGKLAGHTGRLLRVGGGTSLPGMVARALDPDVLRKMVGSTRARKIVVTGSNGKTTTCRMIAALAAAAGQRVFQNRTGSNLIQGITSVAVNGATIGGRLDTDLLIFETDEATMRLAVPEVKPDAIVVTNIFRDQLDRFGELYSVAASLEAMIGELPAEASAILNADDPLIASFAPEAKARRVYFGVQSDQVGAAVPEHAADTIRCVHCQHDLEYRKVYISHLGAYRCPHCGYERPPIDVAVTTAELSGTASTVDLETPAGPIHLDLPLPGLHNIYNAAAAVAGAYALGFDLSRAGAALADLRPAFGRLEEITAGDRRVVLGFVKNPISYNTTLRTVLSRPGRKHVLAAHSNTLVDGEDFAWLWDVDLEELTPQLASLVVSGTKAEEVAMRFKYAGVDEESIRVLPDRPAALEAALHDVGPGGTLYILSGYTPTHELRRAMVQRGWVAPFWEE